MPLRVIRAALLITLAIGVASAGDEPAVKVEPPASTLRAMGRRLNQRGLPNFGEVTPTLYRGAQPSREGLEELAKMQVAIVVDLRASRNEVEARTAERLGMQYVSIPWRCAAPRDDRLASFLKLVRENKGKKIFVHCQLGNDRTGMAIAAYRMSEENWTAEDAMQEMQAFGFSRFHHAMCPGLAGYEQSFPQRLKNNPAFEALRTEAAASPQEKP